MTSSLTRKYCPLGMCLNSNNNFNSKKQWKFGALDERKQRPLARIAIRTSSLLFERSPVDGGDHTGVSRLMVYNNYTLIMHTNIEIFDQHQRYYTIKI